MRPAKVLLAISLLSLALPTGAAGARSGGEIHYSARGCTETVLLFPAGDTFPRTAQISVLVYRCDSATVDGRSVAPFLVSEIGVFDAGAQTLLRHVSNSPRLAAKLRALGFPAYSGVIEYEAPARPEPGIATASVTSKGATFTMEAVVTSSPLPANPSTAPGATYRNVGKDGSRITLAYVNDLQEPVPGAAAGSLDASADPELLGWLPLAPAAGPGLHQNGDWSATAFVES